MAVVQRAVRRSVIAVKCVIMNFGVTNGNKFSEYFCAIPVEILNFAVLESYMARTGLVAAYSKAINKACPGIDAVHD